MFIKRTKRGGPHCNYTVRTFLGLLPLKHMYRFKGRYVSHVLWDGGHICRKFYNLVFECEHCNRQATVPGIDWGYEPEEVDTKLVDTKLV